MIATQQLEHIQSVAGPSLDALEGYLSSNIQPVEAPVTHRFTPGLYIREIFMPAGTVATTKIHKTEHPYVISKGKVSVYVEGGGIDTIVAPFTGITKPGTRRLIYVHEDTVWTTFHVTPHTDIKLIEADIIEPHVNPLLETAGKKEIT